MRMRAKRATGAALILGLVVAGGFAAGYTAHVPPANFHEADVGGRLGFQLYMPARTWDTLTKHNSGITSAMLDNRIHEQIERLIETGIRERRLPCGHFWLITTMGPADTGGVLLVGLCATPAELQAVESERRGRTT